MDSFPARSNRCISQPSHPRIPLAQKTSHNQRANICNEIGSPNSPSRLPDRSVDLPVIQNRPRKEILEGDEGTRLLQQHLNLQVY